MSLVDEVRELQRLEIRNSFAEQKKYADRYNKAVKRGAIKLPTYRLGSIAPTKTEHQDWSLASKDLNFMSSHT